MGRPEFDCNVREGLPQLRRDWIPDVATLKSMKVVTAADRRWLPDVRRGKARA